MPTTFNIEGKRKTVEGRMLKDFLEQVLVHDIPLRDALMQYKTSDRNALEEYIVWRLAEVEPGYAP